MVVDQLSEMNEVIITNCGIFTAVKTGVIILYGNQLQCTLVFPPISNLPSSQLETGSTSGNLLRPERSCLLDFLSSQKFLQLFQSSFKAVFPGMLSSHELRGFRLGSPKMVTSILLSSEFQPRAHLHHKDNV